MAARGNGKAGPGMVEVMPWKDHGGEWATPRLWNGGGHVDYGDAVYSIVAKMYGDHIGETAYLLVSWERGDGIGKKIMQCLEFNGWVVFDKWHEGARAYIVTQPSLPERPTMTMLLFESALRRAGFAVERIKECASEAVV